MADIYQMLDKLYPFSTMFVGKNSDCDVINAL